MNDRQRRFVQEYLIDLNATQAYMRAGYSPGGAAQSAKKLLTNPKIQAEIAKGQAKVANRLEITVEKVLGDLEELRVLAMAAGQYSPATRAAELLGKQIGMFVEKRETKITDERMVVNAPQPEESADDWAARNKPH